MMIVVSVGDGAGELTGELDGDVEGDGDGGWLWQTDVPESGSNGQA